MTNRTCSVCGVSKAVSDFPLKVENPTGFRSDGHKYSPCKACNAERAREWRKKNKNYRGSGLINQYPREAWATLSAIRTRLREAKLRIKKFSLTETDLEDKYLYDLFVAQKGLCALLGYEMVVERKHPLSLSLDQIDPGMGYLKGNVQWVTWVANRAKGDMTQDDFYSMCQIAVDYRKVQRLSKSAA